MDITSHITYLNDNRYPGPKVHLAPRDVEGLPSQAELDAYPRMFTWGELKDFILFHPATRSPFALFLQWSVERGDLGRLARNKEMQKKYDTWMVGMKSKYGSTENYLKECRLPFPRPTPDAASMPMPIGQTKSNDSGGRSSTNIMTPISIDSHSQSGRSTPSSVGFVSLSSLKAVDKELTKAADRKEEKEEEKEEVEYLQYDASKGLDEEKYAVLVNDWPYNVPYGVRHYCVWSRVAIAHPKLINYDSEEWSKIEDQGLGGFTGVHPTSSSTNILPTPPNSSSSSSVSGNGNGNGRGILKEETKTWYEVDISYSGSDLSYWSGRDYESNGGNEVGKMVKGLWDERGWECLWFVNPPRLQSIPGFSHFHVFARRKTPEEIDAAEAQAHAQAQTVSNGTTSL